MQSQVCGVCMRVHTCSHQHLKMGVIPAFGGPSHLKRLLSNQLSEDYLLIVQHLCVCVCVLPYFVLKQGAGLEDFQGPF